MLVIKGNSRMKTTIARTPALIAAALLALGTHAAMAQPSGGHGHGDHGQRGGVSIEQTIGALKGQLNLNTSQQTMLDNAIAQSKEARKTGRTYSDNVRATLRTELAKPEPDFAAVAAASDDAQARNQALRQQVRGEWLKLYATFTPAQKTLVRDAAAKRLAEMDAFKAKVQERINSRAKTT
jgi:Spy/CpxP family protein refolding chaperone